jgi:peroxiredoxin (alkyl hydroperoxide reductase subunit C)
MSVLVGKKAPEFSAKAVINKMIVDNFSLSQLKGQYIVLFFYPLNFTFVCPTELHAFQERIEEFKKRNCVLIGCSVDSHYSHAAWLSTPKIRGGIQGIEYPIISDINKNIAKEYGVLASEGVAYRGLFLIDREGYVRHQTVNDLPLGRSVEEVLRTLDAWIHFEKNGDVCPANWNQGKASLKPTQEGIEKYFTTSANA